jgi:hypothetical protein
MSHDFVYSAMVVNMNRNADVISHLEVSHFAHSCGVWYFPSGSEFSMQFNSQLAIIRNVQKINRQVGSSLDQ